MAIKDNKSITDVIVLFNGIITANGTYYTDSFDGSEYDNGITFVPYLVTNGVEITITNIQDSSDDITFYDVPINQIIGDYPVITSSSPNFIETIGVIGTEKYVRLEFEVENYVSDSLFCIQINANPEVSPTDIDISSILDFNNYIDSNNDFYIDINGDNYGAI